MTYVQTLLDYSHSSCPYGRPRCDLRCECCDQVDLESAGHRLLLIGKMVDALNAMKDTSVKRVVVSITRPFESEDIFAVILLRYVPDKGSLFCTVAI